MEYNSEQVLTAWKAFVSQGIILDDKVRPEIAASWQRCKAAGLDPWSADFPEACGELLQRKRNEYKDLLEVAGPILKYLMVLLNSNISLSDPNGYIFELITPLDSYPRTLGTTLTEARIGTGNVTTALHDRKPMRVDGYEHFRTISQGYSGVSAPIVDDADALLGTININNPFDLLPCSALDICIEAANIIKQVLHDGKHERHLFSTAQLFKNMVDAYENAVIVLDHDGMILMANTAVDPTVYNYQEMPYASKSLGEYLSDKNLLSSLLDCSAKCKDNQRIEFKPMKNRRGFSSLLLRKKEIPLPNGLVHIVLVFATKQRKDLPDTYHKLRQNATSVDYVGQSEAWQKVDNMVHKIARYRTNVLLLGDTGTGKEVVARAIHRLSERTGNFVAVNCGAIPRELLASELFGYEKGSFTGAKATGSIGKFEYATGGTLFLDEIGEMPFDMQVSLLRALQEQTVTRIGSNKPLKIDTHIIAATNRNMHTLIEAGKFRTDLYYRLSVFEIQLPSLSERSEDIPLLADFFNKEISAQLNITYAPINDEVIAALMRYDWPGNVRELKNVIEKMLILADDEPLSIQVLPNYIRHYIHNSSIDEGSPPAINSPSDSQNTENIAMTKGNGASKTICSMLEKHNGNISKAAKELGMSRTTLYKKIEKMNIKMKFSDRD